MTLNRKLNLSRHLYGQSGVLVCPTYLHWLSEINIRMQDCRRTLEQVQSVHDYFEVKNQLCFCFESFHIERRNEYINKINEEGKSKGEKKIE